LARYIVIVAIVVLCAGALLYAFDHKAFVPAIPRSLFEVR
jgi:hypothetical protein